MFPVRRCNIPNLHSAYFFVLFPLFLVTWVKTPLPIPQPGGRVFPVLLSLIASFFLNPWKLYWQFKILFHYLCSNSKMKNTKKRKKNKKRKHTQLQIHAEELITYSRRRPINKHTLDILHDLFYSMEYRLRKLHFIYNNNAEWNFKIASCFN